jgi:hypothetical protein
MSSFVPQAIHIVPTGIPGSAPLGPATPVEAIIQNASVRLEWSGIISAEKYQVYRRTKSTDWAKIGTTKELYYKDKTVESGKNYYYSVIALDAKGKALNDYGEGILVKFRAANVDAFAEVIPEEIEGSGIAEETEAVVEEEIIEEETTDEEGSEEDVIEEETSDEEGSEEDAIEEETTDEDGSVEDVIEEETSDEEESEETIIEEETSESDETVITEEETEGTVEEETLE